MFTSDAVGVLPWWAGLQVSIETGLRVCR